MELSALVLEDESEIRELLALYLRREGLDVHFASNTEEADRKLSQNNFSVLLVDWMLPGESGPSWLRRIRRNASSSQTPALMLTARPTPDDIVMGLESGADDYLTKPFEPSVLMARIRALLRRSERTALQADGAATEVVMGGIRLNTGSHKVFCNEQEIALTPSEFKLLQTLMENQGRVLTRDQLIEQVQGMGVSVVGRTVDTHVFGLRKKLGDCGESIETVRGVGYRVRG